SSPRSHHDAIAVTRSCAPVNALENTRHHRHTEGPVRNGDEYVDNPPLWRNSSVEGPALWRKGSRCGGEDGEVGQRKCGGEPGRRRVAPRWAGMALRCVEPGVVSRRRTVSVALLGECLTSCQAVRKNCGEDAVGRRGGRPADPTLYIQQHTRHDGVMATSSSTPSTTGHGPHSAPHGGNPFTPGFGLTPMILAGRDVAIEEFTAALAGNVPEARAILISGARGSGKTVLLTEFRELALDAGWTDLRMHTSSTSLTDELRSQAIARLRELDPEAETSHLTSARISALSASRDVVQRYEGEGEVLTTVLDRLAALTDEDGGGLLITLDELQSVDRDQLHALTQHVQ